VVAAGTTTVHPLKPRVGSKPPLTTGLRPPLLAAAKNATLSASESFDKSALDSQLAVSTLGEVMAYTSRAVYGKEFDLTNMNVENKCNLVLHKVTNF
jgi:hypothetical protein